LDFPIADEKYINDALSTSVSLSRRLVELGRAARAESGVKIRQPLSRALVSATGWDQISEEIKVHIADELNILKLEGINVADQELVDISVKANFRSLGAKYGADVQQIAKAIAATDAVQMVKQLRSGKSFELEAKISDTTARYSIELDDLVITETPRSGWSVSSHNGESLALDLELTPELIRSGLVREVIRAIQEERKKIGLDVSDRIVVQWHAPTDVAEAIKFASGEISTEVLAKKLEQTEADGSTDSELGLWLKLEKID